MPPQLQNVFLLGLLCKFSDSYAERGMFIWLKSDVKVSWDKQNFILEVNPGLICNFYKHNKVI